MSALREHEPPEVSGQENPIADQPSRPARRPGRVGKRREAERLSLDFEALGGPVVAVCGLAGGAGTTTLAWLLAQAAAQASSVPVMLAELPSSSGGIRALFGVSGSSSLARAVAAMAAERPQPLEPADGPHGLRVLASRPHAAPELPREALSGVLSQARGEHGLVVLDCGTLLAADARTALTAVTHVVWTLPAGVEAADRAQALFDSELAPPIGAAREVLAVTASGPPLVSLAAQRTLRRLSAERCERLVIVPRTKALAAGRRHEIPRRLAMSVAAIAGVIQSERPVQGPTSHQLS
jgi:hypothetical protein